MEKNMPTINEAIRQLTDMIPESNLGSDTNLVLSLSDSGLEVVEIDELALINDDDGAVVEVRVSHPAISDPIAKISVNETIVIATDSEAQTVAGYLVWLSTPFSVEPLPNDSFRFTVKSGIADRVRNWMCSNK